ncbi:MAG: hypothetical protein NWF07_13705 [Candidatus Bathyarchaeota archaeon]|nr:hypothetical protein [Candidatus Bathyarchaeota archaeon]
MDIGDVAIGLNEQSRTYDFGNGKIVALQNVTELIVKSKSGNHRLKTGDGKLHIVPPGWIHIEIVDEEKHEWTI